MRKPALAIVQPTPAAPPTAPISFIPPDMAPGSPYLDIEDLVVLGFGTKPTIYRAIDRGDLPRGIRLTANRTRYLKSEIEGAFARRLAERDAVQAKVEAKAARRKARP